MMDAHIVNFGSINEDRVYEVDAIARPGETVSSRAFRIGPGGKGANQSVALAHAGAAVYHAGKVGAEGAWLRDRLASEGVNVDAVSVVDAPTGHAVIQVERDGENSIVIHGGTNRMITEADIGSVLGRFQAGDLLLLQNETNCIPELMKAGHGHGMRICFNPAPMTEDVKGYPLDLVSVFVLNEHEAAALTGCSEPDTMVADLTARFPGADIVITWGDRGCYVRDEESVVLVPAYAVEAVDTTAAGDTFVGFCLAAIVRGMPLPNACDLASKAAALCVTQPGAMDAIPTREAVENATISAKV